MILAILETLCYAGHNPFAHDNLDLHVSLNCPLYTLMVLLAKYWQRHQNINNSVDSNLVEINASQEQSYQQENDNLKNEIGRYTIDRRKYQLRSTISLN